MLRKKCVGEGRKERDWGSPVRQVKNKICSWTSSQMHFRLNWWQNCFRNLHRETCSVRNYLRRTFEKLAICLRIHSPLLHVLCLKCNNAGCHFTLTKYTGGNLQSHTKSTKERNCKSGKTVQCHFFLHLICLQLEGNAETTALNLKISKHNSGSYSRIQNLVGEMCIWLLSTWNDRKHALVPTTATCFNSSTWWQAAHVSSSDTHPTSDP